MKALVKRIISKVKYPFYLIKKLNTMALEHDAFIETANNNNQALLNRIDIIEEQLNLLTNQASRMHKVIAHQRKRHNALTKRMNDYANQ